MDTNAHEFRADIQAVQLGGFCLIHDLDFLKGFCLPVTISSRSSECCRAVAFLVDESQLRYFKASCRKLPMPVTECVSADQLKSYALGRLDDDLANQVSGHLQD